MPGLVGTILTMTMVMLTSLAMTRERERGTMENLLATPVRPFEVMVGKILPYVVLGYVQLGVILGAAFVLFEVPMVGSVSLLLACIGVFMAGQPGCGLHLLDLAAQPTAGAAADLLFFLPSMLLSGFMFPFRGMPEWAQHIGEVLPLTHFLRIVRGIMLRAPRRPSSGRGGRWRPSWPWRAAWRYCATAARSTESLLQLLRRLQHLADVAVGVHGRARRPLCRPARSGRRRGPRGQGHLERAVIVLDDLAALVGQHRELVAAGFGGELLERVDAVVGHAHHGGAERGELVGRPAN